MRDSGFCIFPSSGHFGSSVALAALCALTRRDVEQLPDEEGAAVDLGAEGVPGLLAVLRKLEPVRNSWAFDYVFSKSELERIFSNLNLLLFFLSVV